MFYDNIWGIDPGTGLEGTLGDQPGDFPMPTNPQTPGAFGGSIDFSTLLKAAPFLGLSALARNSSFFNPPPPKVGYQGGIPMYTATREQTPYVSGAQNEALRLKQAAQDAMATGATQEQVRGAAQRTYGISPSQFDEAMQAQGTYRRPGLGGITYFTPMQYTGTGKDVAALKAGETVGGGAVTPTPGVGGGTAPTGGLGSLLTPTGGGGQAYNTRPDMTEPVRTPPKSSYSQYQIAQAIYDVLNPGGGITGTLAQARQGALNRGVSAQQFDAALMPRLSQAIREARAQMPSATDAQIRDAAARRYGIDAATFDKAASLAAPTNEQIKSQIAANIDKPQEVAWIANTYGLDTKELSDITGFTDNQVRTYFADNDVPLPSANQAMDKFTDEQVAQAIRESMKQGFTLAQSKQGAEEKYGVSKAQIDRVTSKGGFAGGGYMPGGIAMLARGRYLKGNGDGVSDSIPARFAGSGQEARLADGEFVVPARVVSELGNGSSDAGARKLYAMLDRVEARAKKAKRGKPSGADRELNKLA